MNCTKPKCNCADIEAQRLGTDLIRSYPCLMLDLTENDEVKKPMSDKIKTWHDILDEIARQLTKFKFLKAGWDGGIGDPISEYVIDRSIKVYLLVKNTADSIEVTPHSDDSIQLTLAIKDYFVDLIISNSKISVNVERGIGNDFEELEYIDNASTQRIFQVLEKIKFKP